MKFLRPDKKGSQDLSLGALSYTTSINRNFKLEQVLFKASVAITETITISIDSKQGASYDVTLRTKTLSSESSYVFIPDGDIFLLAGDEIKITCTNANLTGTIYYTIKTSEISV